MKKTREVTSIHGNRYRLGRVLGRGGQGAVLAVEGERFAVKLLRDRSVAGRERLRDQLAMVGRLPLEDLPVARPLEQLRPPHVGYVMELVTGMVPLADLLRPPKEGSPARWYLNTGGLRRRLRLLARTAEVLAQIHGRGLIYVDPSPNNVFVSEDVDGLEAHLIDVDNLRVSTSAGQELYTPGYGAPELVRGAAAPSSLSDAYAFAVMAFEALALVHPLLGDMVEQGEPELEEHALAGELPWIDDLDDARNRSSRGIPRDIVLSGQLQQSFQQVFGAGLRDRLARPNMMKWVEYLHRAADRTLRCSACSSTYYYNRRACPWCDEPRPSFVIATVLLWDPQRRGNGERELIEKDPEIVRGPDGKPRVQDAVVLSLDEDIILTERITHGTRHERPRLCLRFTGAQVQLEAMDGESWRLITVDDKNPRESVRRSAPIPVAKGQASWLVHAGSNERLHRVIRFDLHPGAAR